MEAAAALMRWCSVGRVRWRLQHRGALTLFHGAMDPLSELDGERFAARLAHRQRVASR